MNQINIVCCVDNAYAQHCGVMLKSLILTNPDLTVFLYVLHTGISKENISKLETVMQNHGTVNFIYISSDKLNNYPIKDTDYLSIATYLRLFIPLFIPKYIDKILYLDVDILINGSISKLYDTNIAKYALAAVEDCIDKDSDVFIRLNYDSSYSYFNAGVILINLEEWRLRNLTYESNLYIKNNFNKIVLHDQDVLNALLFNSKQFISPVFNLTERFFYYDKFLEDKHADIDYWRHNPVVIHFTGAIKPWFKECKHPYKYLYLRYLKLTPWKSEEKRYYNLSSSILYDVKYYIKYLLTISHLKLYIAIYINKKYQNDGIE